MRNRLTVAAMLLAGTILAGCATPYTRNGLTGGYTEKRVDDSTYEVTFSGNGYTGKDMVWYYWIYRCAELTKEKGYDSFALAQNQPGKQSSLPVTAAAADGAEPLQLRPTTGAPIYYYVPGGTITTYRARGVIHMYKGTPPATVRFALMAQPVLDTLKSYVTTGGKVVPPRREDVIAKALVVPSREQSLEQYDTGTTLDDLKGLLPAP